jgi:hypothetical protein
MTLPPATLQEDEAPGFPKRVSLRIGVQDPGQPPGELLPLRPACWFLPNYQLAGQFSRLQLDRRVQAETVSEL